MEGGGRAIDYFACSFPGSNWKKTSIKASGALFLFPNLPLHW
jgi:hypothetical protein